ncbi:MAG: hypothetical protein FJ395_15605 [Verrucomicrobia bacterium]|nr:hypothetical protein [Verrucomicrobiota bacterium]
MKPLHLLVAMILVAATAVAADTPSIKVIGPDQKPVANFSFLTRPSSERVSQRWKTDAKGECRLTNLKPSAKHVLTWAATWTEKGLMEQGTQTSTLSAGQPTTISLKAALIPKGAVAATLQTCAYSLSSFCLDREERFLVCDPLNKRLRVLTADDKLVKDIQLGFAPQVVACRADGSIVAAGTGEIVLLNAQGVKQATASLPAQSRTATAVGAQGQDVFVCVQAKTGYAVFRFCDKLQSPTEIIKGLRGCCGQMDFKVHNGSLYVAHNTKFLIEKYDRDGKLLSSFGKRFNGTSESFKGCCEPKNICFDSQGNLCTAESSNWTVKKFTPDGKYINFFGAIAETGDCVRATIVSTKDNRIYILDHPRNIIRPVLPGKSKDVSTGRS